MLKDRSIQVKLVQDKGQPTAAPQSTTLDPDKLAETIVIGTCTIIVVYKLASLITNSAEHIVTTKIK